MFDMGGKSGELWLEICRVEPKTTSTIHPAPCTTRTSELSVDLCLPAHEADLSPPATPIHAPYALMVCTAVG
jgi:hypothetical protein